MPSVRGPFRAPAPRRNRPAVFAVGGVAYVALSADGLARVTLTDDLGKTALGSLSDGTQVAILGWRPGGDATRYRVRVTDSGLEGWLAVGNLRGTEVAPPVPTDTPPAASTTAASPLRDQFADSARPFGQRRQ